MQNEEKVDLLVEENRQVGEASYRVCLKAGKKENSSGDSAMLLLVETVQMLVVSGSWLGKKVRQWISHSF